MLEAKGEGRAGNHLECRGSRILLMLDSEAPLSVVQIRSAQISHLHSSETTKPISPYCFPVISTSYSLENLLSIFQHFPFGYSSRQ